MISTFENEEQERPSMISYIQNSQINEKKLQNIHNIIFTKQNQIDSDALQQYLESIRLSKLGKQKVFNEKTQITYIIKNVFTLLKRMLIIPQNDKHFHKIVSLYIQMIRSRENSKHHIGLLEEHLKQIVNLDKYKKNKKTFYFITKIFQINPYSAYKILQTVPELLEWNTSESLRIYQKFISFAASKKNNKLVLNQIKNCIRTKDKEEDGGYNSSPSSSFLINRLDRLKILLANFPQSLITPVCNQRVYSIQSQQSNQLRKYSCNIIQQVYEYLNSLVTSQFYRNINQLQIHLLKIINLFIGLPWTHLYIQEQIITKNYIIMDYLQIWKNYHTSDRQKIQGLLNQMLEHLTIDESIFSEIKRQISNKIDLLDKISQQNNQNFKFLQIIFSKIGKNSVEGLLSRDQIMGIFIKTLTFPLKEQLIQMLDTIRNLDIFGLGEKVHKQLRHKIQQILSSEKQHSSRRSYSQGKRQIKYYSQQDCRLAIKALRKFKFEAVEVYTLLKHYVLKNHLGSKPYDYRKQVVKASLYVLTRQSQFIDKNRIMRQILNIINKDINLKIMTTQWFRDQQSDYQKKIFEIFKEPQFLHILFQDYASNHMLLKRFSIKILCFIYPLNQCEIVPFLKRVYYHIYDRLSAQKLVSFEQKKQALSLTRQILRHRTEIIADDSATLCNFLYNDLYKCKTYESDKQNQLLIELFKTLVDLVRKAPKSVHPYTRLIGLFIIRLVNSKDESQKVKNFALHAFCEIVKNCNYVLIPYFHFQNLYELLRQMFKQGNRNIDSLQLLRLLGSLGYVNKDKFKRIRQRSLKLNNFRDINFEFQKSYRETAYLKSIKNIGEPIQLKNYWNGPYIFTKQESSYSYVEIQKYKTYIFVKIGRIISDQPSNIVNFMAFKVLQAFLPILNKDQQQAYQQVIINIIQKAPQLEISTAVTFSLVSKMIKYQDTKKYHKNILQYIIKLTQQFDQSKQYQLMQILYLITLQYPQKAFHDEILRRLIFYIAQKLTKDQITSYDIKLGFKILQNLADYIDNFLHLFLPQFNKIFLKCHSEICTYYFQLIIALSTKAPSTQFYLPQIIESLLDLLKKQVVSYQQHINQVAKFVQIIIDFTLCMIIIYGDRFKGFIINFHSLVRSIPINHVMFDIAQKYMKKHSTLNYFNQAFTPKQKAEMFKRTPPPNIKKCSSIQYQQCQSLNRKVIFSIIEQFNCDKNQIEDESEQWFNKICLVLYQQSSNRLIRECLHLVKQDRSFSHDVFPLAFYFFWIVLGQDDRKKLVNKLKLILESKVISLRIKQKFIDTIYFMGQWKSPIPLKNKFLCDVCTDILDLAKALFYMQNLFENDPQGYGQSLIKTYCQLGQKQSALGLLKTVHNLTTKTKILLYQKLKKYHKALRQYDRLPDPLKPENMLIKITIRKQMSDWDSVIKLCTNQSMKNPNYKSNLAPLAVEAAVNLGRWDQANNWLDYMAEIKKKNDEKAIVQTRRQRNNEQNFYIWKTMLMIHQQKYEEAEKSIQQARKAIFPKICQLFNFSFERTMEGVIRLQQLSELQQTLDYFKYQIYIEEEDEKKKKFLYSEYKKRLESLWNDRIQGSKRSLNAMQKILMSRNLLLRKAEDFNNWIDFCHLALRENEPEFSKRTLKILSEQLQSEQDIKKKFEIETLTIETKFVLGEIKDQQAVLAIQQIIKQKGASKSEHSICRLYENCALWLSQKQYDFNVNKGNKCIQLLQKTTQKIKKYIRGWHLMGLMHLKMDELLEQKRKNIKKKNTQQQQANSSFLKENQDAHIFQALHCFLKSVSCGIKNHGFFLEDCLKIMNILFNQTQAVGLVDQFKKYYTDIPTEGLIDIIPQIISRLDVVDKPNLFEMMIKLLVHIGTAHPHAIVFPIVFLRKGNNQNRKRVAEDIYKEITKKQKTGEDGAENTKKEGKKISQIFAQTQKIVSELCKVSLKLNQKFKIVIYKLYQQSKTAQTKLIANKYLNTCRKFMSEKTSQLSLGQFGFLQQYRQQLSDIINSLEIYLNCGELQFFRKAQRNISRIYEDLSNSLKLIKKISLDEASPQLSKISNSKVCIPGTYIPNTPHTYISSFKPQLDVIDSKQRPKKLIIIGSDGKQHLFLLKGKEDLRLDQRIMQLFNLINKMFHDPVEQQKYSIQGYSITPISPQTGLISWVQNCDTIGTLIQDYRRSTLPASKIYLQIQQSKLLSIRDYSKLPKPNKVELYKQIQTKVSGWDLRNVFWIRSMNSQEWLKSRSTYVRSLAVMSMVGYIIGLGDRHPHNIMVQRNTGKIVHIDFGDCFDVNRMRKQYPQKVPFRLTRMLVKAMQPCGIHGIFKHTCDKIIQLLRNNKQSILTIIEAFRYDPIISWRFKVNEQENSFCENNPTEESCFVQEDNKQKQNIDSKNKINLYGNKLNFQFAQHVLNQVKKKLGGKTGNDTNKVMSPQDQVKALISEAISPQNLVEHYEGWLIYW